MSAAVPFLPMSPALEGMPGLDGAVATVKLWAEGFRSGFLFDVLTDGWMPSGNKEQTLFLSADGPWVQHGAGMSSAFLRRGGGL